MDNKRHLFSGHEEYKRLYDQWIGFGQWEEFHQRQGNSECQYWAKNQRLAIEPRLAELRSLGVVSRRYW